MKWEEWVFVLVVLAIGAGVALFLHWLFEKDDEESDDV